MLGKKNLHYYSQCKKVQTGENFVYCAASEIRKLVQRNNICIGKYEIYQ